METLEQVLVVVLSLGGMAALIAGLVNTGKVLGVVKDGDAPKASLLLNVILFVGVALAGVFAPTLNLTGLDGIARDVAQILGLLLGIGSQLGLTKKFADWFKGLPVIGFSHSDAKGEVDETVKVVN